MSPKEYSNVGKILFLLRGINIHPAYLLIPITLSIISVALEGGGLGLLIPLLNGFLEKNFGFLKDLPVLGNLLSYLPGWILQNDKYLFATIGGTFVIIFLVRKTTQYLATISLAFYAERARHHLRKTLFGRYLRFGKLYFDTTTIGYHSTLLQEFAHNALVPLIHLQKYINAALSIVVYLVVMFLISWRLTLIALPLFLLLHYAVKYLILAIRQLSLSIAERAQELGKKSIEILSTIPLVKSYQMEAYEQKHFAEISDRKARLEFRGRVLRNLILPLQEVIVLFAAVSMFSFALFWFGRDQIASASGIIVYFYIVINASGKFGILSGFRGTLAQATGPLDAILEIFDEEGKFYVRGGSETFAGLREQIDIRDLSFSYKDDRQVLAHVSFTVRKGSMTAIVGPTGGGKSTLINLLMRYYDCPPGSIFLDEKDIHTFSLSSVLDHIALVSQETLLFNESIRKNITYGLDNVSDADLQDAIERARLSDFIDSLPQGLDTLVGDRGVQLSGGEKQRVSIARALLKSAEILILDEATSSLDTRTEKLIQEAIDEAVKGRTTLVIAHRLSTIKHADHIVVIDQGQCKEQGTLEELIGKKGTFYELWEEQKF